MTDQTPTSAPFRRKHQRTGPELVVAHVNRVSPIQPVVGRVVSNERCSARSSAAGFSRHVVIDVSGTPLEGACIAGQSFGVIPPGVDARGKPHSLRLYSVASPTRGEADNPGHIATTVKRLIDEHHDTGRLFLGVCSNFLCDSAPDDEVMVCGPSGKRFVLPADTSAHDFVFFATGTGIAPFRAMVLDLVERRAESKIVLVAGVPYATDLFYHDLFTALAHEHPNFTYIPTISRHAHTDGSPGCYVQDRLTTHATTLVPLLESSRSLVYVCGVSGMELGIFRQMADHLPPAVLSALVAIDEDVLATPDDWHQRMVHRQIRPSGRVFIETY